MYIGWNGIHYPQVAPQESLDQCSHLNEGIRKTVCGMMKSLDDEMLNIENALIETGLYDDTLILFMSDNGGDLFWESINEPYAGGKMDTWEGGMKSWSFLYGGFLAHAAPRVGFTSHTVVHVTDWFPTLVNIIGGNFDGPELDGVDVWNAIIHDAHTSHEYILLAYDENGFIGGRSGIRAGEWKFMANPTHPSNYYSTAPTEPEKFLFNMTSDPYEEHNLVSLYPDVVQELEQKIQELASGYRDYRNEIFDTEGSNPNRFNGYWVPWLTEEYHADSCSVDWTCETPCAALSVSILFYMEVSRPCPFDEYIGPSEPGNLWRMDFHNPPCFWISPIICACASAPCQNGGTCNSQGGQPICDCPSSHTGRFCEIPINTINFLSSEMK